MLPILFVEFRIILDTDIRWRQAYVSMDGKEGGATLYLACRQRRFRQIRVLFPACMLLQDIVRRAFSIEFGPLSESLQIAGFSPGRTRSMVPLHLNYTLYAAAVLIIMAYSVLVTCYSQLPLHSQEHADAIFGEGE